MIHMYVDQCEICGWKSTSSNQLQAHKSSSYQHLTSEKSTDEFPYTCTDCNLCFRTDRHMKLHRMLVEKCIANEMRDRRKMQSTTNAATSHSPTAAATSPPKESKRKMQSTTNATASHSPTAAATSPPKESTGLTKVQRKTMEVPESSCVASNECPVCHAKFEDSKHRLFHQRLHRINHVISVQQTSLFSYKCTECKFFFQTKEDLNSHTSKPQKLKITKSVGFSKKYLHSPEIYNGESQFCPYVGNKQCPVCHRAFAGTLAHVHRHQLGSDMQHFSYHKETSDYKYRCKECKMYFNSEKHLNMHINGNTAHNKVDEDESETTFVEEVERSNDSIANDFNNSDDDHNQQPEYISSTRRTLNKVNEIQQSTGNNKLAGVHTLSNELMRGAVTSSRSPLSETRDELIEVEDESKRHILDNLATKTNIFTICNPGK